MKKCTNESEENLTEKKNLPENIRLKRACENEK